jgi:hypothetical protein
MFPAAKQRLGGHKFKDDRGMKTLRPTTQTTIDVQQKNPFHDTTGVLIVSGVTVKVVGYQCSQIRAVLLDPRTVSICWPW